MIKKVLRLLTITLGLIVLIILAGCIHYNVANQQVLVFQFGKVVNIRTEPGLYCTVPFIQKTKEVYVGENLYDIPETEVITSDKKSMKANCYVTWQVIDTKKYYSSLSSESVAQSRIDVAVYNAMKNVISSTSQENVIAGKNGSLGDTILKKITSIQQYGIEIMRVEMKVLDLPTDNKESVYKRMISERQTIAAEYKAQGEKKANTIKTNTDAQVRKIVSDAQVTAAKAEAEGEKEYYKILADAYGKSSDRKEFYNFMIGLDAMKESLKNGGTFVVDEKSPLYSVINNK